MLTLVPSRNLLPTTPVGASVGIVVCNLFDVSDHFASGCWCSDRIIVRAAQLNEAGTSLSMHLSPSLRVAALES